MPEFGTADEGVLRVAGTTCEGAGGLASFRWVDTERVTEQPLPEGDIDEQHLDLGQ